MTRHVVIGTAGHVDHGKTSLVKALTGTDTDRWEEEKRRGITIDLGFATLPLGEGITASVVDVPGHEDFVRNMVAGATGVDVALLVVAADEGVMPQTIEHLAILEFLGVRTGVVAVSKVDLVDEEWVDLVEADLAERLSVSPVAWERPVRFSAVDGRGGDALVAALRAAAHRALERSTDDLFRMPVDRVFSVAGAGTVVTGTTWSGAVRTGDEVRILPGDHRSKVRSVEVHGEARNRAEPGRRTALALPGVDRNAVGRGSVVVTGDAWRETTMLDVSLTLLAEAKAITQRTRVRLHLGTAEVLARVTPAGEMVEPGTPAAARLRLERPIVARWGDRGVIRSYSPVRTIGGCIVADPFPPPRPRRPHLVDGKSAADPRARLTTFVTGAGEAGLDLAELPVRLGLHPGDARPLVTGLVHDGAAREVAGRVLDFAVLAATERAVYEAAQRYHEDHPLEPGVPLERVRALRDAPAVVDAAIAALVQAGRMVVEASTIRDASFRPALAAEQEGEVLALRQALVEAGAQGLTEDELRQHLSTDRIRELAEFGVRQGLLVRIGRVRYYDAAALDTVRGAILDLIREAGRASPAEVREITGLTRKYLIPILEWLDAGGFTVRDGDGRRLGPRASASV
jgi:selenocysteine-specific elongation factor